MTPNWCRKIRKIQIGQIKRMVNRKTGKRVPFRVPQLVNSSRTIFFGTYHPRNRQVEDIKQALQGKVYTLQGQCVASSLQGLSKGVYIINGKKVIIK
jgi:hypothetical protein